jgi:3-oxoacyl-[acyl-carrier protein] reductase
VTEGRLLRALVTGANGGIGSAVVSELESLGFDVYPTDIQPESATGHAKYIGADVTDESSVRALRDQLADRHAADVDILCNIAGIFIRQSHVGEGTATFRKVLDVNLWGTFLMTHHFLPAMIDNGFGRVINTGSVAGVTGYPFAGYSASKFGVIGLTKALMHDIWGSGVTVNAVCPGAVRTPMMNANITGVIEQRTPTGAVVEPDEIARVFGFLAGRNAGSINGQTVVVDGGATASFRFDR